VAESSTMHALLAMCVLASVARMPDDLKADPGVFGDFSAEYKLDLKHLLLPDKYTWARTVVVAAQRPEEAVYLEFGAPEEPETADCRIVSNRIKRGVVNRGPGFVRVDPVTGAPSPPKEVHRDRSPPVVDHAEARLPRAVCDALRRCCGSSLRPSRWTR
jgi:hypothetical protein